MGHADHGRTLSEIKWIEPPLNRYRNVEHDCEDPAAYEGAGIHLPTTYIAGQPSTTVLTSPARSSFIQ